MPSTPLRVLVVDDSAVVRETMVEILSNDSGIGAVTTAADPLIALRKMGGELPDVITLDIEMPRMDGLSFIRELRSRGIDVPIVVCSGVAAESSDAALEALSLGAAEVILKPRLGTRAFLEESRVRILDAVKAAHLSKRWSVPRSESRPGFPPPKLRADAVIPAPAAGLSFRTTEKVVVVGTSTGGTEALRILLEQLPVDAPGIVAVQHMPEHFTRRFADRLDQLCHVTVKEAEDGDAVSSGRVLIAPGNRHTLLKRSGARYYVEVRDGPLVSRHRPSVDVLFRSAARYAGPNAIGVIMTGMGDDGARGTLEMKRSGALTIAQDEHSCVVFGMPREAIEIGGVDRILPLTSIPAAILAAVGDRAR